MGRISRQRLRLPPSLHLHHRHPAPPSVLPRSATAIANAAQYPKSQRSQAHLKVKRTSIRGCATRRAPPFATHKHAHIQRLAPDVHVPTSLPTSRPHPRPLHALLLVRHFYLDTSLVPASRCPVRRHESRYLSGRRLRLRSATRPCCSRRRSPRP
ncbi:hypothetical protein C8J57DRAFT_1373874, partial [Mycena rebaudengoi]